MAAPRLAVTELTNQNTIQITWTNGMEGIKLTARRTSTGATWRGRTEPFSDVPVATPGFGVSLRPVNDAACDPFR